MPYDQQLADRLCRHLCEKGTSFTEKQMMGGQAFMVNDKVCPGIIKDDLVARIGSDPYEEAFRRAGYRPMDFTGRPVKGCVFISREGTDSNEELAFRVQLALEFYREAKASKTQKKKKDHGRGITQA